MTIIQGLENIKNGEAVTLVGWLQQWLEKPGCFLMRTLSGLTECYWNEGNDDLRPETLLEVEAIYDPNSRTMLVQQMQVLSPAPEFPDTSTAPALSDDPSWRHLRIRHPHFATVYRIRHHLTQAIHAFFSSNNFFFITAPVVGGIMTACEDISRSFHFEHEGRTLFLSQSARVYKEAMVYSLGRVYLIQPSFRKDTRTPQHLQEFSHLEAEWITKDEDEIIEVEENFVLFIRDWLLDHCEADLLAIAGDTSALSKLKKPFPQIDFLDAKCLLNLGTNDDFLAEHEMQIIEKLGNVPVVLRHFPLEIKGFYAHRWPENTELVETHDILFPGIGEVIGGAIRENDVDKTKQLMLRQSYVAKINHYGYSIDDHQWYLDLKRYGNIPHGGFGAGIERLLQWVASIEEITETVPFPRVEGQYFL